MTNEKRLIDANVIRHNINVHLAGVIYRGDGFIPSGKDSNSAYEYLRGYEEGARYIANLVLQDKYLVDAVEVVHGRWRFCGSDRWNDAYECSECGKLAMNDSNYCPNCGAKMDGDKE